MSLEMDLGLLRTYRADHKMFGANVGSRMTVIKLKNGELFVHNPIRFTPEIRQELDDFGLVSTVVAPNDLHHLFIKDFMVSYSGAEYVGSPGLRIKRNDLKFSRYFNDEYCPEWKSEIDFVVFQGSKSFHEIVFYHLASKSLILTDLAMNLKGKYSPLHRLIFWFLGLYHCFATSSKVKSLVKNRVLAREALNKMLHWPFERIIMSHGEIILQDCPEKLRKALAWL
jgi:hypothetical protein